VSEVERATDGLRAILPGDPQSGGQAVMIEVRDIIPSESRPDLRIEEIVWAMMVGQLEAVESE
jgi:hypothetical protein